MAAYYFDASAALKQYVIEPGTERVMELPAPNAEHDIYISAVGGVEVVAALSRRGRDDGAIQEHVREAIHAFREDFAAR